MITYDIITNDGKKFSDLINYQPTSNLLEVALTVN